jgi:CMP-N-acetylneuraminic acid synthetase
MTVAAITCARMDSKRFAGKVLAPLAGKPLIQHTVDFAKNMGWPLYVMTYDEAVMRTVAHLCPIIYEPERYRRNGNFTFAMMRYANEIIKADYLVLLQPTQPVRVKEFVQLCIDRSVDQKIGFGCVIESAEVFSNGNVGRDTGLFYIFSGEYLKEGTGMATNFIFDGTYFDIDTEDDLRRCEAWIRG